MATTFLVPKNNATTTTAEVCLIGAGTVAVVDGSVFPLTADGDFHASFDDEIVLVTANATNTFTITRAQESTAAAEHASGVAIRLLITAKAVSDLNTAVNTLENGAVMDADFNATTFLYATSDDTPQAKTPAEVMAILSGQAAATFSMNTQKISGVVDPTADQEVATKKYVDDRVARGYSATIENPADGDDIKIPFTNIAITITEINAVIRGGTSVTFWVMHNPDRSAAGLEVDDTIFTCNSTTTGNTWDSGFEDATIPADSHLWIEIDTVTGAVEELSITIFYTID